MRTYLLRYVESVVGATCGTVFYSYVTVERSTNPDFGDYFSPTPLRIAKRLAVDPGELSKKLLDLLPCHDSLISKIEATGSGFINFFLKPMTVLELIPDLVTYLRFSLHEDGCSINNIEVLSRKCGSAKLRLAIETWRVLHCFFEQNGRPQHLPESSEFALLSDPEEFSTALFIHDYAHKREMGITDVYLYELAVCCRDSFFWHNQIAPYWIHDPESPDKIRPRGFLLWLVWRVLGEGLCRTLLSSNLKELKHNETRG